MPSKNAVECFFHPDRLNSSWCVKCGEPVCHRCDNHSIFVASGYSICPPCKSKQVYIISAITIPVFTFLTILCSLLLVYEDIILPFLFSISTLIFLSIYLILDIKDRKIWEQTCDNYSDFKGALEDIIKSEFISCDFHSNSPSIGTCDVCGSEICLQCSRIRNGTYYSPTQFLCIGHYWKKQGRTLLIFSIVFLVISFILISLLPLLDSSIFAPMFFIFGLPLLLLCGGTYLYYLKIKWDFQNWQSAVDFELKKRIFT